jgi:CDP-4-dehydro-6-deoxyglucose reductase/ferredoxin-NAD(P)+ reductase (naphthalene dioxygenase ferredoxin-specific)
MAFRVSVPQLGTFDVGEDETIVEAATRHGIAFPFSCHSGTCGTCKSKLVSGDVTLLDYSKFTLRDEERAAGLILACCAIPKSDCDVRPVTGATPVSAQHKCEVASIEHGTHDIKILKLTLLRETPLHFMAGQFADLTFPELPMRSYSMASRPGEPLLEFHVRLTPGGKVSPFVHSHLSVGQTLQFRGPLGSAYLRDDHTGPIIALAGGSGLGPIKSIVDTLVAKRTTAPIHFYFGVRDERDLYYAEHFRELEKRFQNLTFTPVLSEPSCATERRTGFLADVIKADFQSFAGFKAYLAGPPVMVETSYAVLESRGLDKADFHADAF